MNAPAWSHVTVASVWTVHVSRIEIDQVRQHCRAGFYFGSIGSISVSDPAEGVKRLSNGTEGIVCLVEVLRTVSGER